jgi:inner membrane protein
MIARTHDLAAITALGVVFLLLPPQSMTLATVIIAIIANLIGGITPDIDQPTAPLWRNLPIGKYFGKAFAGMLGGHRFFTHSLIGLVAFAALARFLLVFFQPVMPSVSIDIVWWAFIIGMLSHLVMDTLTKEGVPWLLPVPVKFGFPPFKALRITTDTWVEIWVVFPALIIFNAWFYFANYPELLYLLKHTIIY